MIINPYAFGGGGPPPSSDWFDVVDAMAPDVWFRFGETSGTTAANSGAASLSGTIAASVTLGQASLVNDSNGSFLFPGTTTGHVFASNAVFNKANTFTLQCVYEPTSTSGDKALMSMGTGKAYIRASGTSILFIASNTVLLGTFTLPIAAGNRYLITVRVLADTTSEFFLNEDAAGTGTSYGGFGSAGDLWVGTENGTADGTNGYIDEPIYARRLITDTEIGDQVTAAAL